MWRFCTSLFNRYLRRGETEKIEIERRFQLFTAFDNSLGSRYLYHPKADRETKQAALAFMKDMLSLIRRDAIDEEPDMWVATRLELGFDSAVRLSSVGKTDEAMAKTKEMVELLEKTMKIKDKILLPTSCRFLNGMERSAREIWESARNDPDAPKERMIQITTTMNGMTTGSCVRPGEHLATLQRQEFAPIRNHPEFQNLCERVKALIVTRTKEN